MSAVVVTLVLSTLLSGAYLRLAGRWQMLDRPNGRSSHQQPTPHGGGAALLTAFFLGLALAAVLYGPWERDYLLLGAAALLLMLVGIADDLWGLPVWLRLALYSLCCLVVAQQLLALQFGVPSDALLLVAVALSMLWLLNLYNFMDGIDGIAATQCVLACGAAAILCWATGTGGAYSLFCLLLAVSHLGFLVWNWPPARLFMGDAGSVPTGFLLAGLALLGAAGGQLNPACWLVLLAIFITDASWTLFWRIATGQKITQAHRLHAYQRLSDHWGSQLRVDLLLLAITALWLLPWAAAVAIYPDYTIIMVIMAYVPLLLGMAKVAALP